MASKRERVYNEEVTASIYPNGFIDTFGRIVQKDSPGRSFGFSNDVLAMLCLDQDAVEKAQSGVNDKTVDCSTVISVIEDTTLKLKNHRHLFIELKLNCTAHNLKRGDYQGKVDHSLLLIQDHCPDLTQIHPEHIFLFTDSVKGRAKRDVSGWSRGSGGSTLKRVVILGPSEFNEYVGFPHQFPYKPKNTRETIEEEFAEVRDSKEDCLEVIDYWYKKAIAYGYSGLTLERHHIADTVSGILSSWIEEASEELDMEMEKEYLEEFENLLVKVDENS